MHFQAPSASFKGVHRDFQPEHFDIKDEAEEDAAPAVGHDVHSFDWSIKIKI